MTGGRFDPDLLTALRAIARTPNLLVATDYDGTLAPIVEDPSSAGGSLGDHSRGRVGSRPARPCRPLEAAT